MVLIVLVLMVLVLTGIGIGQVLTHYHSISIPSMPILNTRHWLEFISLTVWHRLAVGERHEFRSIPGIEYWYWRYWYWVVLTQYLSNTNTSQYQQHQYQYYQYHQYLLNTNTQYQYPIPIFNNKYWYCDMPTLIQKIILLYIVSILSRIIFYSIFAGDKVSLNTKIFHETGTKTEKVKSLFTTHAKVKNGQSDIFSISMHVIHHISCFWVCA